MNDTNERPVASSGSQPVAWSVDWDGEIDCDFVYRDRESAMDVIADNDETSGVVVPLYREPLPMLTDEQREAIAYGVMLCDATAGMANDRDTIDGASNAADVLRGLLARKE
jgi:hypothetical protein